MGYVACCAWVWPITLPIAFVPFKLDGQKLGTINRIKVYRSAPDKVKSVDVSIRLADSVSPHRLADCILVAEGFEKFNSQTTIRCAAAADTADEDLADIGQITLTPGDRSFRLLMPRDAIRELTDSDTLSAGEDSAATRQQKSDSIVEAAGRESGFPRTRPGSESGFHSGGSPRNGSIKG